MPTAAAGDTGFAVASARLGPPVAVEVVAETLAEQLVVAAFVKGLERAPCNPGEPWPAAERTQ